MYSHLTKLHFWFDEEAIAKQDEMTIITILG